MTLQAVTIALAPTRVVSIALTGPNGSLTIGSNDLGLDLVLAPIFRGRKGDPGPSGSIGLEIEQIAVDGVNTITVGGPFVSSATQLYINGLRQSKTSYFIAGLVVTLPANLQCVAGDVLTFEYLPT